MQNVKIVHNNTKTKNCFIFATSNASDVDKDRFEWENISKNRRLQKSACKMIFLKDPSFSYYAKGINDKITSIDELISFLREETKGLNVSIIGASAGGYLAILLACFLDNVEKAISISGVFNIYEWTGAHNTFSFNDMKQMVELVGTEKDKYFNLIPLLSTLKSPVYHFFGSRCVSDNLEIKSLDGQQFDKFKLIPIISENHGHYLSSFEYIKLILTNSERLEKTYKKIYKKIEISRFRFAIANRNLIRIFLDFISKILRKLKKLRY